MTSAGRGLSSSDECPECGVLASGLPCIDWRGEVMATPHAGRGPLAGRVLSDRERIARAIFDAGGWAGECCCHTAYEDCTDCRRVCLSYADAALAVMTSARTTSSDADA